MEEKKELLTKGLKKLRRTVQRKAEYKCPKCGHLRFTVCTCQKHDPKKPKRRNKQNGEGK